MVKFDLTRYTKIIQIHHTLDISWSNFDRARYIKIIQIHHTLDTSSSLFLPSAHKSQMTPYTSSVKDDLNSLRPGDAYMHKQWPAPRLNIKTVLSTYGDFHVKDKTDVLSLTWESPYLVRPSFLLRRPPVYWFIFGLDNGLSAARRQAITSTNYCQ